MSKVLVYGTLKKGLGNHVLLKDAKFLGTTTVRGRMYSLGAFPGVRFDQDGSIKCEAYEVDEPTVKRLDRLEGYRGPGNDDNFYNRVPITFQLNGNNEQGEVYEINDPNLDSKGRSVIESGEW